MTNIFDIPFSGVIIKSEGVAMEDKKWPVLGQVLIALGVIGSLMSIVRGFSTQDILGGILGIAALVIYWSVYKFKKWALTGLTILLSLTILLNLVGLFRGTPILICIMGIVISAVVLMYFNSAKIKELFQ
jgi:hypothetical protein